MTTNEKNVSLKTSISAFTFGRSLSTLIKCEEISVKYEEQNISFGTKSYFSVLLLTVLLCIFFYQPLYPAMYFDINFSVIIILLVFGRKLSSSLKGKLFFMKPFKSFISKPLRFWLASVVKCCCLEQKDLEKSSYFHVFKTIRVNRNSRELGLVTSSFHLELRSGFAVR